MFQVPQPVRSGKDMLVSFDTIKCFAGKIGEKNSFKKKPDGKIEKKILTEPSVNKILETIMADENESSTQDQINNVTDEDNLMELLNQFFS